MAYTQENRLIAIETPLGPDVLLLQAFNGREAISQLFSCHAELLSVEESISFEAIVGKNVTIRLVLGDGSERFFNGFVSRFSQSGQDEYFTHYEAEIVPWLWFLTQTSDCRIFQNKSVPDIIEQIFKDLGFADYKNSLQGTYEALEYCVQYRETDFNFVSRLMEQYGISYFFEHADGKHTLVLVDAPAGHPPCPVQAEARCAFAEGAVEDEDVVSQCRIERQYTPGKYALADYNFEAPKTSLAAAVDSTVQVGGNTKYEVYDYPGEYEKKPQGDALARMRMEEEEATHLLLIGSGTCRTFVSGYRFDLKEHYRDDLNDTYLLTEIEHAASMGDSYVSGRGGGEGAYSNQFSCIPHSTPFRPPRITPKPMVQGVQTAMVVGPKGEEIWTDKYGRVKVQFHWDREGKYDENSSCWIRVSQSWAGKRWGAVFLPRIGQEVIVEFEEGDPDRPIITGRVYNAEEMPPYDLPAEQTKSTVKTLSSKGGGGFNEIRFEDKKGDEQIFIHGEKDIDVRIKNDRREWIGRNRDLVVKRDKREEVGRDQHVVVKRDHVEEISRDRHLSVTGKEAIKVTGSRSVQVQQDVIEEFKMNHSEQVTLNYYLKGMQVVIEGMAGLTIKVGGSFVTLSPAGVQISGPMLMLNSGGAPLSGTPGGLVSPTAPAAAMIADNADPGSKDTSYKSQFAAMSPADQAAQEAPSHDPDAEENREKKSWIEIELVDEEGRPVPGERYRITLPDGSTLAEGTLDEKGFARVDGIDPGTCKVTFPDLDKDAWERA